MNVWHRFIALNAVHKQRVFLLSAIHNCSKWPLPHTRHSNFERFFSLLRCSLRWDDGIGSREYRRQWLCLFVSLSLCVPTRESINILIIEIERNLNYIINKNLYIPQRELCTLLTTHRHYIKGVVHLSHSGTLFIGFGNEIETETQTQN